jgi:hypothetical protein
MAGGLEREKVEDAKSHSVLSSAQLEPPTPDNRLAMSQAAFGDQPLASSSRETLDWAWSVRTWPPILPTPLKEQLTFFLFLSS